MRDVATSYLHVNAKGDGLDMDCVKLWCGQVGEIDPLRYDKFYKDATYIRTQYLIAEKYLDIISNPNLQAQNTEEVKGMKEELQELKFAVRMLQDASGLRIVRDPAKRP